MTKYPYFVYPLLQELKESSDPERIEKLKELVAANVGDTETLVSLIGKMPEGLDELYPRETPADHSTESTIDTFISKFGGGGPLPESLSSLSETAAMPADEETEPENVDTPDSPDDLMERAKEMVKNHDYSGALEIMEAIYLNNPKKSVYFADQIRFVRKLAYNQSKLKH